jgi:hypothetical protein
MKDVKLVLEEEIQIIIIVLNVKYLMENIFITLYMEYQENVLKMMKQKKIITLMKKIIHINHVMKDVLLVQDMVLSQI